MQCEVFKGSRKPDHYLYLPVGYDQAELPTTLLSLLGSLEPVLELELTAERKLANADSTEVLAQLEQRGFYLQLPPGDQKPEDLSQ